MVNNFLSRRDWDEVGFFKPPCPAFWGVAPRIMKIDSLGGEPYFLIKRHDGAPDKGLERMTGLGTGVQTGGHNPPKIRYQVFD